MGSTIQTVEWQTGWSPLCSQRPRSCSDRIPCSPQAEVERCLKAGEGCPGYFMSISGHIPPNVPVENALYYDEVYRELRER